MKKRGLVLAVLLMGGMMSCPLRSFANESVSTVDSARSTNKLGFYLGVGDPYPGIIGVNVGYNVMDALRLTLGYAEISTSAFGIDASAQTIGVGAVAMVPGWNFTPTLGLHYAYLSYSGDGAIQVGGFTQSAGHVYGSAGIDYQAKGGYNFGAGYNYSFMSGIGGAAYVQLGWFFNWLS
jgi:hypothetical protein